MKIPFLRFSPEYSVAVDAPKLSPWLKEGLGGTGAECIDISDMNVIEAANKVRSSIQALVLQDADDDRAESIIAATLPKLIIRIQPRRSFSDPLMFEHVAGFIRLSFYRMDHSERICPSSVSTGSSGANAWTHRSFASLWGSQALGCDAV